VLYFSGAQTIGYEILPCWCDSATSLQPRVEVIRGSGHSIKSRDYRGRIQFCPDEDLIESPLGH